MPTRKAIRYVTHHFRDRRGDASLHYRSCAVNHHSCVNRNPIRYSFLAGAKAIRYRVKISQVTFWSIHSFLRYNFSLHNAIRGITYLLELKIIKYHESSLIGVHIHTRVPKRFLGSRIWDMKQKECEIRDWKCSGDAGLQDWAKICVGMGGWRIHATFSIFRCSAGRFV